MTDEKKILWRIAFWGAVFGAVSTAVYIAYLAA
jgi:uncharacterized membrane protein (DUF2068 family)